MRNVQMSVTNDATGHKLTMVVDLAKEGKPSSSGKSIVLGSTEGNVPVEGHPEIKVGLNVYKSR